MSVKKILIAVDSSEYSLVAAKKGFQLARQTEAEAALIFVVDTSKIVENVDAGIFYEETFILMKKEAIETLDQLSKMYYKRDIRKFITSGHVSKEIIKTAESWKADMIVTGTHGKSGLMHLLVGSVAENVIRHSDVPVLVVPIKK